MRNFSKTAAIVAISSVIFLTGCAKDPEPTATNPDQKPVSKTEEPKIVAADFEKDIKPTLTNYCLPCHAGAKPAGQVDVTKLATNADAKANMASIAKMIDQVESAKMPPEKGKPLPDSDRAKLVKDLKSLGS